MRNHPQRADTEAIVDGTTLATDHPLGEVQDFFATMRAEYGARLAPEPRPVLASILDGRRPLRSVPDPVTVPITAPKPALGPRRGWRPVAAVFATGAVVFSSFAAAGALPSPLQRLSAEVGERVGIDLPRPSDATPTPARTRRGQDQSDRGTTRDSGPRPSSTGGATGSSGDGVIPEVPSAVPTTPPPLPTTPTLPLPLPLPIPAPGAGLPRIIPSP